MALAPRSWEPPGGQYSVHGEVVNWAERKASASVGSQAGGSHGAPAAALTEITLDSARLHSQL